MVMSDGKISLSLGGPRRAPPPTNGVKRPRAALHEEDDDEADMGKAQTVSHFDQKAGGAIDETKHKEEAAPLVIPKMANRDWKEAANKRRRQKSGLPDGPGPVTNIDQRMAEVEALDAAKKPGFGLNLYNKQEGASEMRDVGSEDTSSLQDADESEPPAVPKTDDELAMDALLGRTSTNKQLVINGQPSMTEADAFQHDFEEAPDMATLDDYARVPVEDFGAAMLRGMGWKEGEGIGSQKGKKLPKDTGKLPKRRANLVGIGAKEDPALAQEMGVWGQAAKYSKEVKIYNPVLLRDKRTGDMYTEEELQKKREDEQRVKYEEEFERNEKDRHSRRKGDDKSHHRPREEQGRDHDRNSRGHHRDRRKYDDDHSDEEDRRQRRDRERRRDRSTDRKHTSHDRDRKSQHGHRDRDSYRSRDERDRHRSRR